MSTFSASGSNADASWDGTAVKNVRSWSVEVTQTAATGAHSDSSRWTDAFMGIRSWTASVEFYQDDTIVHIEGIETDAIGEGTLTLTDGSTTGSGNTYGGSAVLTGVSYSNDVEGAELVVGTASFVGNGAFSVTQAV